MRSPAVVTRISVSQRFERIATEMFSAEQVLGALQARSEARKVALQVHCPFVAPQTKIEQVLAELWGNLLRIEPVGIHDDFFELGGTSLQAVELVCPDRSATRSAPIPYLVN